MTARAADPVSAGAERAEQLAGVGTWTLDLKTGGLTINATGISMLGRPDTADLPDLADFLAAVHPQDRGYVKSHTDRLVQFGEEYSIEHRALLPGGVVRYFRAVATAVRDETGRVVQLLGITLDVTAARLASQEAERARDRSQAVLSSLSEGYLLTADGLIVEVNEALCRLTGYAEHELVGTGLPYLFWPTDEVPTLLALRGLLISAGGGRAQVRLARKDRSRLDVAMTMTGLTTGDGKLWVMVLRDITHQLEHQRQLERRSATDELTGLANSRAFRDGLRAAVAATYDGSLLTLALIDVDHFKSVNDRFGHAVGDNVLVAVANRLRTATDGAGTLARVGGEEFALLLPGFDETQGHLLMTNVLAALRSTPVPDAGIVTASAGVAQLMPDMDDDGLYRLADTRLYDAKARGRDQVR